MKIQPKQYAEALLRSVDGKKDKEIKTTVKQFVETLAKNNNISLADKVIEEFSRLWNQSKGIIEAEVTVAHEQEKAVIKDIEKFLKERTGESDVVIKQNIDKGILGGLVIKYRDRVLDGSLKMKLSSLKEKLVK